MGHLLTQPRNDETIALSKLGLGELLLVYMSQFNNLPWRIPLCINQGVKGAYKVIERPIDYPPSREQEVERQLEETRYTDSFTKEQLLPVRVYEIDIESTSKFLLTKIVQSKDKQALSKKFMELLFSVRPSKRFHCNSFNAVSPYEGIKMGFWLVFESEIQVDVDELFIYKKDLANDVEQTISLLMERCDTPSEMDELQQKLSERIRPNSIDRDVFPVAEALVRFTFRKKRLPYQGKMDRERLWRDIAVSVAKYNSWSEDKSGQICYIPPGNTNKTRIFSDGVTSDIRKTYYSKLLAELSTIMLPDPEFEDF